MKIHTCFCVSFNEGGKAMAVVVLMLAVDERCRNIMD